MDYIEHFLELTEASLIGKSRTGQMPNWDYYVKRDFDSNKPFYLDNDGIVFSTDFEELKRLKKNDTIYILSKDLIVYKNSKYAKVKGDGFSEGLLNINKIRKPTISGKGAVIGGGKNSKEFTPAKLGLEGITFSSVSSMVSKIASSIKSIYGDSKYYEIRKYLADAIKSAGGVDVSLNESFSRTIPISVDHKVSESDIKILSKNFGEVLGGLYILKNNKKATSVEFPKDVAQGLYDFLMNEKTGKVTYYSVKAGGGSSTSMANINFVLNNFTESNSFLKKYSKEVQVIKYLMNNKEAGDTTLTNIERFYNTILKKEKNDIISRINKISSYNVNNLSQNELDKWFKGMVKVSTEEEFISTMMDIYSNVFKKKGKATTTVLKQMYQVGDGSKFDNGYLYYPMGSYITSHLNETGKYREILNLLLNFGSYINQLTVTMGKKSFDISIVSFKKMNFRFSYNAGAKYPANRPLGFIKQN